MDEKEDVIKIELTQYGKYLLSKGKLRPYYYSFFDDNILYDSQYAGFPEKQNNAETRTREVPQTKLQYVFSGIETNIKRINELVRAGRAELGSEAIQPTAEKNYALSAPLGNSSLLSEYAPSWNVKFLYNDIEDSVSYVTGSQPTLLIPQISSSIEFETYVGDEDIFQNEEIQGINDRSFADGTYIKVKEDMIVLEIEEENVPFEKENFDIEVFLIESYEDKKIPGNTREQLIPLSFVKNPNEVDDSVQTESELSSIFPVLDSNYVEYFLDISLDNEIDENLLSRLKNEDKSKNFLSDRDRYQDSDGVGGEFDIPLDDDFEECED
jgi:hypothetical protein